MAKNNNAERNSSLWRKFKFFVCAPHCFALLCLRASRTHKARTFHVDTYLAATSRKSPSRSTSLKLFVSTLDSFAPANVCWRRASASLAACTCAACAANDADASFAALAKLAAHAHSTSSLRSHSADDHLAIVVVGARRVLWLGACDLIACWLLLLLLLALTLLAKLASPGRRDHDDAGGGLPQCLTQLT